MKGWKCNKCGVETALSTKIDGVSGSCLSCKSLGSLREVELKVGGPEVDVSRTLIMPAKDRPKDKAGKYQPHLVCPTFNEAVARVREYGVMKYKGEDGWKQQTPLDYMDAIGRHYDKCRNDPKARDEESGLLHIAQIATSAMFIIQMLSEQGENLNVKA